MRPQEKLLRDRGVRFRVPRSGTKKYIALIPNEKGGTDRVEFGHRDYEQYADTVPADLGGQQWTHLDHGDPWRRESYKKRAAGQMTADGERAISVPLSPAWLSYHFLW